MVILASGTLEVLSPVLVVVDFRLDHMSSIVSAHLHLCVCEHVQVCVCVHTNMCTCTCSSDFRSLVFLFSLGSRCRLDIYSSSLSSLLPVKNKQKHHLVSTSTVAFESHQL